MDPSTTKALSNFPVSNNNLEALQQSSNSTIKKIICLMHSKILCYINPKIFLPCLSKTFVVIAIISFLPGLSLLITGSIYQLFIITPAIKATIITCFSLTGGGLLLSTICCGAHIFLKTFFEKEAKATIKRIVSSKNNLYQPKDPELSIDNAKSSESEDSSKNLCPEATAKASIADLNLLETENWQEAIQLMINHPEYQLRNYLLQQLKENIETKFQNCRVDEKTKKENIMKEIIATALHAMDMKLTDELYYQFGIDIHETLMDVLIEKKLYAADATMLSMILISFYIKIINDEALPLSTEEKTKSLIYVWHMMHKKLETIEGKDAIKNLIVNEIKQLHENDNSKALEATEKIMLNMSIVFGGNKNSPLKELQKYLQDPK